MGYTQREPTLFKHDLQACSMCTRSVLNICLSQVLAWLGETTNNTPCCCTGVELYQCVCVCCASAIPPLLMKLLVLLVLVVAAVCLASEPADAGSAQWNMESVNFPYVYSHNRVNVDR
jgi:hypothetical protein